MNKYNLSELEKIAQEDTLFFNKTLVTYINNIDNAIEKIRMENKEGQWDEIGEAAHKLIPASRFLGLHEIVDTCIDLETDTINNHTYLKPHELSKKLLVQLEDVKFQLENELKI